MKKRNYIIDILKGFAILLVVYIHLNFAGARFLPKIREYIHTFDLPLFSFASGFLTCGRTDLPFGKYFVKKG
ncbi:MAG: acyltransferase family protein, partial [Abditibacteriota bacterium]|nr:acyltransferase family protein [Abditibacteriota bacterium]